MNGEDMLSPCCVVSLGCSSFSALALLETMTSDGYVVVQVKQGENDELKAI